MDPWNLGIFSIMSVMVTVIGIILATRFVYLDNRYNSIIKNFELDVQDIEEQREKQGEKQGDDTTNPDLFLNQFIIKIKIGEYTSKRADNREHGIWIDLFCLFMIIILGIVSTFGFFASQPIFTFLVFVLVLLFSAPIAHFILHARTVNKMKSI